jgi:hypothetical protein
VLIAAILTTVALGVLPSPGGSLLVAGVTLVLLVVVVATWVQLRRHDRSLCERCVRSMPVNPSLDAERFHRRLALAHAGSRPGIIGAYLAVLVGADVAVALAPPAMSGVALVLWASVQSTLVYLVLSHVTHRRLQPWCPRCGGGGEGRDEDADDRGPVPSTSMS